MKKRKNRPVKTAIIIINEIPKYVDLRLLDQDIINIVYHKFLIREKVVPRGARRAGRGATLRSIKNSF
ncbi:MAG: hypothetical protein ACE5F2_01465 [Candidatus Paceibacteria bacterium]